MAQAAVRIDDRPLGRDEVQRPPDPGGDHVGRFHLRRLDVDHAESQPAIPIVLAEQL